MMHQFRARVRLALTILVWAALALFITACSNQGTGSAAPPAPVTEEAKAAMTETMGSTSPIGGPTETSSAPASPLASPTAAPSSTETTQPAAVASPTATATLIPSVTATSVPPAEPQLDSLRLILAPVAEGLSGPLFVTHAGDGSGRLFIVEKTGAIRIFVDNQLLDPPFLDLSDRITSSGSEQGLLGLAFPPDYATRKFFFVNYTDRNGDTVNARYDVTDDPNIADPGSEHQVIGLDQPAPNHNGGNLIFGPDGYLWIGTGDGGAANDRFGNGQNPGTRFAKMLRVDVTTDLSRPYIVPPDNPWVNADWEGKDVLDEVWAIGLRNPWRYSFDRETGDLWIADVGQNRIEEVNVVRTGSKGGLNFGWPIMEGPDCFREANCDRTGLEIPVASYSHGADGCSITGGYVYRGEKYPALVGTYLYGDFCSGRIWGLNAAKPGAPVLLLESGLSLSSFGEDEAGELYVTDLRGGTVQQIAVE